MTTEAEERTRVLAIADSWRGTPFHDQACLKGAGVDCAMIIKAIFEEAGLIKPFKEDYYSPTWFLHKDEERYLHTILSYAVEITQAESKPADIVVFRIGRLFAHGAIIIEPGWPNILHAYKLEGYVTTGLGDVGELGPRIRRFFRFAGWEK